MTDAININRAIAALTEEAERRGFGQALEAVQEALNLIRDGARPRRHHQRGRRPRPHGITTALVLRIVDNAGRPLRPRTVMRRVDPELGYSKSALYQALHRAVKQGWLAYDEGAYQITEAGRQELSALLDKIGPETVDSLLLTNDAE